MTDYKIGEVARLLGLTTQALRFYEQEGVVTPKKSENGTRYYDEDQLILLLSFKKYRQADFSVQDIVTHFFKEDDLSGLRGQTLARRDMLLEQSALLRRRAEAFGTFEARLAYAQRHLDEPTLCERPLLHMLSPSLSELDFVDFKSRDSLEQFIAAMPDTRISFARKSAPGSERDFRLCANDEACAAWHLPLEHTQPLAPVRCVRVMHGKSARTDSRRPMLKSHVNTWLRQHQQVLGFASCHAKHGGTGAVYVILRRHMMEGRDEF